MDLRHFATKTRIFKAGISSLLAVSLCVVPVIPNSVSTAQAKGGDRTLYVHYTHTGERERVTFRKNGRYVEAGLKRLAWLTRDWRRNLPTKMDPRLFDLVWSVYQEVGATEPIRIVSGYRSKKTNDALRRRSRGVAKTSQHTLGKAMDFFIPGVPVSRLREVGMKMGVGGVGYYPGSGTPFVHMDTGNVRHWPRMTPSQLARLFPDGKTLHTPTTRVKQKRYAEALKEYQSARNQLIQPLTRSKRTRVASADSDGRRRGGGLFGLFRSEDEDKSAPKVVTNRRISQPVIVASRIGANSEPNSGKASSSSKPETKRTTPAVIAALPRPRPELRPDAVPQPVVVANRVDDEDTTPLPSRIGRSEEGEVAAEVKLARALPPAPIAAPQDIRDSIATNNRALVIAAAPTPTTRPAEASIRNAVPAVITASLNRSAEPDNKNVDETVTAALNAAPEETVDPVVIRSTFSAESIVDDPTRFLLREEAGKKSNTKNETTLAFAAPNSVDSLPQIDRVFFDERFGHLKVASDAIREAAKVASLSATSPSTADAPAGDSFEERFASTESLSESRLRLASISDTIARPQPSKLATALEDRIRETKSINKAEKSVKVAAAPSASKKGLDISFKTKIIQNLHSAGLLTKAISSHQELDLPAPGKMPELFHNPNRVYAGSFSQKGDVAMTVSFTGKALEPTPMRDYSPLVFTKLERGSQAK